MAKFQNQLNKEFELWGDDRKADAQQKALARGREEQRRSHEDHDKAQRAHADAYREKVVRHLRMFKIPNRPKAVDLDLLYVPILVGEEELPLYASPQEMERRARGEPEELLRASRKQLRDKLKDAMRPEDALAEFSRIVVLGDPGAGKTTMLRHLTFRAARAELVRGISLPVYVELRQFLDSGHEELLAHAAEELERQYGFPDAEPYLREQLDIGRAILLFDGLDEVLAGETEEAASAAYYKVVTLVDGLAARYPNAAIMVTCRKADWRWRQRGGMSSFTALEMLDFEGPQITKFIDNWFQRNPAKGTGLRDALSANLRMQTLAANPLLLSQMAALHERGAGLRQGRKEAYARCVDVLLEEWDAHRKINRFSRFHERKGQLLQEVAWRFHQAGRFYFSDNELLEAIGDFLPTIGMEVKAEDVRDEIAAQNGGLLKAYAHEWYGFAHLAFQEYFAALAADHDRDQGRVAEVASGRHSPWWDEVILILAAQMSDASPLLLHLLRRDPDAPEPFTLEALAVHDDLFQADLLLAGHCLAAGAMIKFERQWLRKRLTAELERVLKESPYSLAYNRAARILAGIEREGNQASLLALMDNTDFGQARRAGIAVALGHAGNGGVAKELVKKFIQLNPSEEAIADGIADALATMRFSPAIAELLKYVEDGLHSSADYRPSVNVILSIGAFGDHSVKPRVWELTKRALAQEELVAQSVALIEVIGKIGDPADAGRLLGIAGNREALYAPILRSAVALSGGEQIASVVVDPGSETRLRWLSTAFLAGYPKSDREQELATIVNDPSVDKRLQIGVASVLAEWGNMTGLSYLRGALAAGAIADEVPIAGDRAEDELYFWAWAARSLRRLGDDSLVSDLFARYRRRDQKTPDADVEVARVLAEFTPPDLVKVILAGSSGLGVQEARIIASVMSKEDVPLVLGFLESMWPPDFPIDVIGKLGELADTRDDASRLLTLVKQQPSEAASQQVNALAKALDQVSRRALARAFKAGVYPLDTANQRSFVPPTGTRRTSRLPWR